MDFRCLCLGFEKIQGLVFGISQLEICCFFVVHTYEVLVFDPLRSSETGNSCDLCNIWAHEFAETRNCSFQFRCEARSDLYDHLKLQ